MVQPRRRYLAGTARPVTPLDNGVADEPVNPSVPVENADPNVSADVAVPATPTEQDGPLDVTGADVLEETANQPAPTGRGHRRRRPPASLSWRFHSSSFSQTSLGPKHSRYSSSCTLWYSPWTTGWWPRNTIPAQCTWSNCSGGSSIV